MQVEIFEIFSETQTDSSEKKYRMNVCDFNGQVVDIYEGNFRQILNALLEVQNPDNQTLCIRKKS